MTDRFVPLTPRVGAKVVVPRYEVLAPAFADECLEALERHGVLVFPGIAFDDDELVAFSENLGEIMPIGGIRPDGTRSPVMRVTLDPRVNPDGANYLRNTIGWHIDGLFENDPPPRATLLTPRALSGTGGQTEFCNTYAAYDELSADDQRSCEPLRIAHSLEASERAMNPNPSPEEMAAWQESQAQRERKGRILEKEHPLVWHHRSGRRSLVLGMTAERVVGMPEPRSRALIERLSAHTTRRENVYRHDWEMGDLLMWDNCGVMHRVTPYDAGSGRLMHRTTLHGSEMIEGLTEPSLRAG